jgi:lipoprotein-anchoring transpeptidase ErfK/SrfK
MHQTRACSTFLTTMVTAAAFAGTVIAAAQTPATGAPTAAPQSQPATIATLPRQATEHLAIQVALDRAGFSPGELDAAAGANTDRALRAFQRSRELAETGLADWATVAALGEPYKSPVVDYVLTEQDAAGPFVHATGEDMMAMAGLEALGYSSAAEMIAERFHASPALLRRLNPGARFAAGERLVVPNVEPFTVPASGQDKPAPVAAGAATIVVSEAAHALDVTKADGTVVFHAPVSMGSDKDPLPKGEWKVNGTAVLPKFHYNPELFWDADASHAKATIAPGPNNPVGVVWIDLNKEHLGFHGTPEPARIGRSQSHGCLRLTNWDAMRLAALVGPGTKVVLQ